MRFILLCLLVVSAPSYGWDELLRLEDQNKKILLEFDEDSSEIRIKHKSASSWGLYKRGPKLSIESPTAVDQSIAGLSTYISEQLKISVESEGVQKVIERIEEFKYLSQKECRALHFNIEGHLENSAPIKTLLDQVNRIRLAQSPGEEAFRSIHINTFATELGPIQLRMVLGKDGRFLKFSFARSTGSLVDFDWEQMGNTITLWSPEKKAILEIDTSAFSNDGGVVVAKSSRGDRVEQESRSFFRLTQQIDNQSNRWNVTSYKTQHFETSVIKSGVPLTTGMADHTPIIQLRDKEVVFQRLSLESIKRLDILKLLNESSISKVENFYNQCMGERLSFRLEEERFSSEAPTEQNDIDSKICVKKAQIEAFGLILGFPNESELGSFRNCLKDREIANTKTSFFSYDEEVLQSFEESEFENSLIQCYRVHKRDRLMVEMRADILSSTGFKEVLPGEKAIELLATEILKPFEENCLDKVEVTQIESCKDYAAFLIEDELFNARVSSRLISMNGLVEDSFSLGSKSIVEPLKLCQSNGIVQARTLLSEERSIGDSLVKLKEARLNCSKKAIVEFSSLVDHSFFISALSRTGLSEADFSSGSFSADELGTMRSDLRTCWVQFIEQVDELVSLVEEVDFHLEACLPSVLKKKVADKLFDELSDMIFEFSSFYPEDSQFKEDLQQEIKSLIFEELKPWQELGNLDQIRTALLPKVSALLYTHHTSSYINRVANSEESVKRELEKMAMISINAGDWNTRQTKSLEYFSSDNSRPSVSPAEFQRTLLRDSLKQFYLSSSAIVSGLGEENLSNEEILIELRSRGQLAFNECFETYTVNTSESIRTRFNKCEKRRIARVTLHAAIKANEQRVSALIPLNSTDANKILITNQFLSKCFEQADRFENQSFKEFENSLENCVKISEFDISMSLSLAQVESYKEISQLKEQRSEQVISCFSQALLDSTTLGPADSEIIESTLKEVRQRSALGGGVLGLLPGAHIENGTFSPESAQATVKLLGTDLFSSEEQRASWEDRLKNCEERIDSIVKAEFREFVMRSIPSLDLSDEEDPNTTLMRDFLDVELVELILEFQRVNEAKLVGNRVLISESSLESRLITSDLGMGMLVNFVDLLGDLIGKGFVYDEAAMRTELVVFQSELKGFLRWYTTNAEVVSIEQAQDFFQSSKLSEHLSMAVVSEKVYENFLTGIEEMRKRELNELFSRKRCFDNERCLSRSDRVKYRAINKRFAELRELSREMTSSYDFRRIIRPETDKGQEIIEAIKDSYLMPKAIGQRMNARAEESMMGLIGEAILRDNTDGGFAEKFVQIMAQAELDKEKERRWGITEWIFFDDLDFDWERLKQTEAGLRAINYYSRFIMLPEALGRPLGRYELRLRKDQFRRLITAAQSENTD